MASQVTLWPTFNGPPSPVPPKTKRSASSVDQPDHPDSPDSPTKRRRRIHSSRATRTREYEREHIDPPRPLRYGIGNEFSEAIAQMSILSSEIQDDIVTTYNELVERNQDPNEETGVRKLGNVIDKFHMPRTSPARIDDLPETPKSPNVELANYLRHALFDELKAKDEKFRGFMVSLTGIRQWWDENCNVVAEKKLQVKHKSAYIESLKKQLVQFEARLQNLSPFSAIPPALIADINTLEQQIKAQEEEKQNLKQWFVENHYLCKTVYERFKELEAGFDEAATVSSEESLSIQVSLQNDYPRTNDYALLTRFRPTAIAPSAAAVLWWFDETLNDFKPYTRYLARLKKAASSKSDLSIQLYTEHNDKARQNVKDFAAEEQAFDNEITEIRIRTIRDPANANRYNEQIQQRLFHRNRNIFKREEQQRLSNLTALSFMAQECVNIYIYNDLLDRHWRSKIIFELLRHYRRVHGALPVGGMLPVYLMTDLVNICHWEFIRQQWNWYMDDVISDEVTSSKPFCQKTIFKHMDDYCSKNEIRHKVNKELDIIKDLPALPMTLSNVKKLWQSEAEKYISAATQAQAFSDEASQAVLEVEESGDVDFSQNQLQLREDELRELPRQLHRNLDSPSFTSLGWTYQHDVTSMVRILERRRVVLGPTHYERIDEFISSPDIWPLFKYGKSWTRHEFEKLFKSLTHDHLGPGELDAYLVWCNLTNEKFITSMILGDVIVSPKGWEQIHEKPMSLDLGRKIVHERPHGARKLELLVEKNQNLLCNGTSVDCTKGELLTIFSGFLQDKAGFGWASLDIYLNYWDIVGKYWVKGDPRINTGLRWEDQQMKRVDHGWQLDKYDQWPPISEKPADFDTIDHKVRHEDIRPFLDQTLFTAEPTTTEARLYEAVTGKRPGKLNHEINRHSFHLYLRWCATTQQLFKFARNGEVEVIENIWGPLKKMQSTHH